MRESEHTFAHKQIPLWEVLYHTEDNTTENMTSTHHFSHLRFDLKHLAAGLKHRLMLFPLYSFKSSYDLAATAKLVRTTRAMALWKSNTQAAMKYATYPTEKKSDPSKICNCLYSLSCHLNKYHKTSMWTGHHLWMNDQILTLPAPSIPSTMYLKVFEWALM